MSAELNRIHAFWCRTPSRPNFGDALTPWLIRRMTGQHPTFMRPEDRREKYLVVGSIIGFAGRASTVWGSGIMNRDDQVSPDARLLAVRGPLTRARALACGADCADVYGDPATLLPRLYSPSSTGQCRCGVVGHFSDMPRLKGRWRDSAQLQLIDIQDPIETVIDRIASCDCIASSSLHGLIVSHAYGVPAVWIKFRDLPSGDDVKFHDYYLSLGSDAPTPLRLNYDSVDAHKLVKQASLPRVPFDSEPLWRASPFTYCR